MRTSKREAMHRIGSDLPSFSGTDIHQIQRLCKSISHVMLPCVVLPVHSFYLSSLATKGSITEPTCGFYHSFLEIWFSIFISGQGKQEQKINRIILSKESLRQPTHYHPKPCSTVASHSKYPRQEVGSSVTIKWSFLTFLCTRLTTTALCPQNKLQRQTARWRLSSHTPIHTAAR